MEESFHHSTNTSSFSPAVDAIVIPKDAYRPIQKCPFCKSVYLTDTQCEACGRSLQYDPVGEPFGGKSYFAIKERYVENFDILTQFYPVFEKRNSTEAKAYGRKLQKRLIDLLDYFQYREAFYDEDSLQERKLFYIECKFIIVELIEYDTPINHVLEIIEQKSEGVILSDLVNFTRQSFETIEVDMQSWWQRALRFKPFGFYSNAFYLGFVMLSAAWVTAALIYFKNHMN